VTKDLKAQIAPALDALKADVVHVGLFDYAAMFRERRLRRDDFLATLDTAVFANVPPKWDSAENIFAAGPYRSERIAVDAESIRPYPFEAGAAVVVADYAGPQKDIMPRALLRRQIAKAEALGYTAEAAFEFEFIVLAETADTLRTKGFASPALFAADNRCWSGQTAATFAPFVADLESLLRKADVDLYSLSGELGPGCFEATLRHRPALRAADDAAFFRSFTKSFCRQRNLTASFMAMLGAGFPGIGGHVSVSLKDKRGRNAFAAPAEPHGLSSVARSFLAGMIEGVPEAFPLCNHTVNDYRRLAPGSWAPKTMSWAPYNYAAAVRTAAETPAMTRLEFRLPGADCNPFMSLALVLATGLDGLERGLELTAAPIAGGGPGEIPEGVPRLPLDLASATTTFRASEKARRWFGEAFVDHFTTVCEVEDAALRRAVSAEEVRRYLEGG
jgi:glutamine synthetase